MVTTSTQVEDLERFRAPIAAYCYRMLGSPHAAEDAVQETMVRAWRAIGTLHEPGGLRSWLYKIATNVCLDAIHERRRRALPMDLGGPNDSHDELGRPLPETTWVQPYPTRIDDLDDPLERAIARDSIRLAFVAALQHLLPRQRAVLILRDVLRWRAAEVAELLDASVDAVNSTLRRARAALTAAQRGDTAATPAPAPVDAALLERYVRAFERFDIDEIVALLHHDVVVSMPPFAFWLRGREAFRSWLRSTTNSCPHGRLMPTEANGCPAYVLHSSTGEPSVLHVLEWRDDRIAGWHAFIDPGLVRSFVPA